MADVRSRRELAIEEADFYRDAGCKQTDPTIRDGFLVKARDRYLAAGLTGHANFCTRFIGQPAFVPNERELEL